MIQPPMRTVICLLALLASSGLPAQARTRTIPPAALQIRAAVAPLPLDMRDSATVLGYRTRDKLEVLRQGTNGMTCIAIFALETDFHVACYQSTLEPFMSRGRELRAQGVKGEEVDSIRAREIKSGKLAMPASATMYQLFGGEESFDSLTGAVSHTSTLLIIYMPFATGRTTGLSEHPNDYGPWLMYPGSYKAHMMLMGEMH